jgi:mitochondrial fission protein ELM1
VTGARLAEAAKRFAPQVDPLPHPRIAVLLSGESAAFSFPPELATTLGAVLARLARKNSGSLLVTPSRATRADSLTALSDVINGVPHLDWNGTGDNPYSAFLALSDAIVTTEDSVNMVTEAAATGKPVYVQRLKGSWTRLTRASRTDAPINDTAVVASLIRRALHLETKA